MDPALILTANFRDFNAGLYKAMYSNEAENKLSFQ